jgi:tetratricopeptide (TPR) repeat protein
MTRLRVQPGKAFDKRDNHVNRAGGSGRNFTLKALLLALVLLPATSLPLAAQGGYSLAGANGYVARQDWNGLLAYTRSWTRANPNEPLAWYYMGQTYGSKLNRQVEAANAFERAVALKPHWPEAWWALGYTDMQLKRYPEAQRAVSTAVEQAPDRLNYRNGLAAVYSYLNRWDDVVRTLDDEEKVMERVRTGANDWYNLGLAFFNSKQLKQAEGAYNRTVKLNPGLAVAWTNLGATEQLLGNSQAALAGYQRGASLGDHISVEDYAQLHQALTAPPAARRVSGIRPIYHPGDPATYLGPPRDASGVGYGGTVPAGSVHPPD